MNDFSVLETVTRKVEFRGEQLNVSPLKVGQMPPFTRAIRPCLAAIVGFIVSVPPDGAVNGGGEPTTDIEINVEKIVGLIADHGEAIIEAVSIATKMPREKIEDATPEEFLVLVTAVIGVNIDFFARAMAKAKEAAAESHRAASGTGLEPSSS